MRVTVDLDQLAETSTPLRTATEVARDLHRGTHGLRGSTQLGHADVEAAVADFLQAWGQTLDSVAQHGDTLARMLDLAGSVYAGSDDRARRHNIADPGGLT